MAKIPGSIKTRSGSPLLWYRICGLGGREFYVPTETASRREAERNKRLVLRASQSQSNDCGSEGGEDRCAGRRASSPSARPAIFISSASANTMTRAARGRRTPLGRSIGSSASSAPKRRLAEIDDGMVSGLIARRRGEKKVRGKTVTNEFVSATTVNRSATEPLRKVLLFARDIGKAPIQKINWQMHLLKEPKERVRELRDEEQVALFDEGLRDDYKPLVEVALMLGFEAGRIDRPQMGTRRFRRALWSGCSARATRTSGCRCCRRRATSCGACGRTLIVIRNSCLPSSPSGRANMAAGHSSRASAIRSPPRDGKRAFRRAVEDAGIKDFRMHDNRHTAASRLHREIGLRGVQGSASAQADRDDAQVHPRQQRRT